MASLRDDVEDVVTKFQHKTPGAWQPVETCGDAEVDV